MVNKGSLCFANASLQCLLHIPEFVEAVLGSEDGVHEARALIRDFLLLEERGENEEVLRREYPKMRAKLFRQMPKFGDGKEHDAFEFTQMLLNILKLDDFLAATALETSFTMGCANPECQHEVVHRQPSDGLALQLPLQTSQEQGRPSGLSLQNLVKEHFARKPIRNFTCTLCGCKDGYVQTTYDSSAEKPAVLKMRVQRGTLDPKTHRLVKRADLVRYQENDTFFGVPYRLKCLLCHKGALSSGHYYSYVHSGTAWYRCDDEDVEALHSVPLTADAFFFYYTKV